MRSLLSSIISLVSKKAPPKSAELVNNELNLISKKTEILLCKNERKDLQNARRKSIQKTWAASIIAEEEGQPEKHKESGTSGVASNRKEIKYFKRVTGAPPGDETDSSKFNRGKKTARVYRRRLSDSTWTTEPMDDKLIWVDCEMTGLKVDSDMIMEIGCIVTGPDLKEIARTSSIIIHVPDDKLAGLDAWCLKHHGDSGLIEACRQSKVTSEEIDDQLLNFIQKHSKQGECPMAGNSIYMDRMFISKQFPKFHSHFHYRNVDVSTLKELVRRWHPDEYSAAPKKRFAHRVVDDIEDSIAELKYYRSAIFRGTSDSNSLISESIGNKN